MTRAQLRCRLIVAVAALIAVLSSAILLKVHRVPLVDAADERVGYSLVKDVSPLLLGILVVFLTSWYQQRMAFLVNMRALWSHMIEAKTAMLAYAATPTKQDDAYRSAYRQISRAIDEVRTVYRNVGEDAYYIGWYPYEPLQDMRKSFEALRDNPNDVALSRQTAEEIERAWAALRWPFLAEFGAPEPTDPIVEIGARPQRLPGTRS